MNRILFGALILGLWLLSGLPATSADKDKPKQSSLVAELLRHPADEVVQHFDANDDGVLTKDEVPFFQDGTFEKLDVNRDGKLDAKEIDRVLQELRAMDAKALEKIVQAIRERSLLTKGGKSDVTFADVARWLQAMDRNKDGKISRPEAQGRLRENFTAVDVNKDGFLNKKELQSAAVRMLAAQSKTPPGAGASPPEKGGLPPGSPPPDFDTLDQNADGRITRDELKVTPFLQFFDAIDANKDGRVTPKEWDAFVKKQSESKEKLTGKND